MILIGDIPNQDLGVKNWAKNGYFFFGIAAKSNLIKISY